MIPPAYETFGFTAATTLPPISLPMDSDTVKIFLVEDMRADALLTKHMLDGTRIPYSLMRFKRGDDVLLRLNDAYGPEPSSTPDLIMLDLWLPSTNGFEVIAELAHRPPVIRSIPIVVLTGHKNFEYIQKSYPQNIIAYLNKPGHPEHMRNILLRVRSLKKQNSNLH